MQCTLDISCFNAAFLHCSTTVNFCFVSPAQNQQSQVPLGCSMSSHGPGSSSKMQTVEQDSSRSLSTNTAPSSSTQVPSAKTLGPPLLHSAASAGRPYSCTSAIPGSSANLQQESHSFKGHPSHWSQFLAFISPSLPIQCSHKDTLNLYKEQKYPSTSFPPFLTRTHKKNTGKIVLFLHLI